MYVLSEEWNNNNNENKHSFGKVKNSNEKKQGFSKMNRNDSVLLAQPKIFASIYKICKCESRSPRQTFAAVENVKICVLFDGTREQCAENKKT